MLVLTRKLQEQIKIGDEIIVTILQVRGQSVRVGIQREKRPCAASRAAGEAPKRARGGRRRREDDRN